MGATLVEKTAQGFLNKQKMVPTGGPSLQKKTGRGARAKCGANGWFFGKKKTTHGAGALFLDKNSYKSGVFLVKRKWEGGSEILGGGGGGSVGKTAFFWYKMLVLSLKYF